MDAWGSFRRPGTFQPWRAQFEPQQVQIGNEVFTANSAQELNALNAQRLKSLNDQALRASMPDRPAWDTMLGKDNLIDKRYQIGGYANQLLSGNKGFNKFQEEALRDGPSAYAKMLLEQQELERADNISDIGAQYQMGIQNQLDSLASQGGVMSGAGERMGAASIRDMLAARQGARRDNQQQNLGIRSQDEMNRIQQLQGLTGLEQQRNQTALQAREFDLKNSLNERDARRRDGQDAWKTEMETWASNRQADAQASAANNSCFPGSTLVEMSDGLMKRMDKLELGDETLGGTVTKIVCGLASGAQWYDYKGIIVTGSHVVFDTNGEWVRVEDSPNSVAIDIDFSQLYNIATEDHFIKIGGIIFSDYDETDKVGLSFEESLKFKNRGESCSKSI